MNFELQNQLTDMLESVLKPAEVIHGRSVRLFKDEEKIASRVLEMGKTLTDQHQGNQPVVIGILHGAFIFTADLVRAIRLPCKVDFWRLSSYGNGTESCKSVQELMPPSVPLQGQDIILVEDIVDSGHTLNFIRQELTKYDPRSVTTVALVKVAGSQVEVDHFGFISNGEFLVGYGLDIAHSFRELPALYYVEN